jgi:hypothetical protein
MDNEITFNKYLYLILENNVSIESFTTKEFGLKNQLMSDKDKDLDMESINKESSQDPVRSRH